MHITRITSRQKSDGGGEFCILIYLKSALYLSLHDSVKSDRLVHSFIILCELTKGA